MNHDEFEEQVLSLTQPMYRLASSLLRRESDRQDAVQQCILLAWERRGQLRDEGKFRPWLMRILVNCCHSLLRPRRGEVLVNEIPFERPVPLRNEALRDAIDALPDKLRPVIVMHYLLGMEVKEIAYCLRITEGTVKSRLARARAALRELLKEDGES